MGGVETVGLVRLVELVGLVRLSELIGLVAVARLKSGPADLTV